MPSGLIYLFLLDLLQIQRSVLSFSLVSYTLIYALKIYFITYTVFVICQSGFILHKV